jgi:hypothetical protein
MLSVIPKGGYCPIVMILELQKGGCFNGWIPGYGSRNQMLWLVPPPRMLRAVEKGVRAVWIFLGPAMVAIERVSHPYAADLPERQATPHALGCDRHPSGHAHFPFRW